MITRRYLIGGFSSFSPRSAEIIRFELEDLGIPPRGNHNNMPDHPPWNNAPNSPPCHSQSIILSSNSLSPQATQQHPYVSPSTNSLAGRRSAAPPHPVTESTLVGVALDRSPYPSPSPNNSAIIPTQEVQVLGRAEIISRVRENLERLWSAEWKEAEQGGTTRSFFPSPVCAKTLQSKHLPYQLVQIFTGHSYLNAHQSRLGFVPDSSCPCGSPAETVEHYLFHCPRFTTARESFKSTCERLIGIWPPSVNVIHKSHPAIIAMSSFVRTSGRLDRPMR